MFLSMNLFCLDGGLVNQTFFPCSLPKIYWLQVSKSHFFSKLFPKSHKTLVSVLSRSHRATNHFTIEFCSTLVEKSCKMSTWLSLKLNQKKNGFKARLCDIFSVLFKVHFYRDLLQVF